MQARRQWLEDGLAHELGGGLLLVGGDDFAPLVVFLTREDGTATAEV